MTDPNSLDNWQLQDDGDENKKEWQLQETEQEALDLWQLEETGGPDEWQPVEYVPEGGGGRSWILPAIITLALIVVVGYVLYIGLGRFLPFEPFPASTVETAAEPGAADATAAPGEEAASATDPTAAPTETPLPPPTPVPPTPAPPTSIPPTAVPMLEQQIATVNSQYGINARRSPSADSEIIRIMEDGETAFVLDQQGEEWVQVFLTEETLVDGSPVDGELAWVAAEFVEVATEMVPPQLVADVKSFLGIEEPAAVAAAEAPAVAVASDEAGAGALTVSVNSPNGLNARSEPSADSEIVTLLPDGGEYTPLARSEDGAWIQIELEDGTQAWVASEFVTINGDLNALSVVSSALTEPATTPVTTTAEITATTAPTATASITATGEVTVTDEVTTTATATVTTQTDGDATVTIDAVAGVNARAQPNTEAEVLEIVAQGSVLAATGQSEDGEWVQVELEDGSEAWVFKEAVTTSPAVNDLPVPGAAEAVDVSTEVSPTVESQVPVTTGLTTTTPVTVTGPVVTVTQILAQVYPAPDTESSAIALVTAGDLLQAVGINADQSWVQVALPDNRLGWIAASLVDLSVDPNDLRVAQ